MHPGKVILEQLLRRSRSTITSKLYEWVEEKAAWDLSIVRPPRRLRAGGGRSGGRWRDLRLVEVPPPEQRTEKSVLSSEAFIKLSMIQLMSSQVLL